MFTSKFLIIFVGLFVFAKTQICDPTIVEWLPHPNSCQRFIICFHGNPLEFSCAPGLHFSERERKCMFPADAKCDVNYVCPPEDDEKNPIFISDRDDCQKYFVCFKGLPIPRTCADNLWFDVNDNWCTYEDDVTCDHRTSNNPNNPNNPTSTLPPSTTTVVTIPTEPPILTHCFRSSHLFNPDTGSYTKSSCIVNALASYDQSEEICQQNNMNLFVIDDSNVQTSFFRATTSALVEQPRGMLWINGRRESSGEWFSFNPNRAALYNEIDWVRTDTVDGRTSGDCLRYSQQNEPLFAYQAMGASCNATTWFTCEYFSQPKLNTDICWRESALIDEDGNVMKTQCIINEIQSHSDAEQICLNSGMTLFAINNSTVQLAFSRSISQQFPNGHLWINGLRDIEQNEWFTYEPKRIPIFSGLDWVETDSIDGRTSGDCLRYSQLDGPYAAIGTDCSARSWFICEF